MKPSPLDLRREDYPNLDGPRLDKLLRALNTSVGSLVQAVGAGLLFGDNLKAAVREVTFTAKDPWIAPSMQNSWVAVGSGWESPAYRMLAPNIVKLRGAIKSGTIGAAAFTLPAGYRPAAQRAFAASSGTGTTLGQITVGTDGTIVPSQGSNAFMSLGNVEFEATSPTYVPNPVFPIRVKNDLGSTPAGVWIWSAVDVTSDKSVPAALGPVAWSVDKDQLVVNDVGGVCAGRKYRVKLISVAG